MFSLRTSPLFIILKNKNEKLSALIQSSNKWEEKAKGRFGYDAGYTSSSFRGSQSRQESIQYL